MTPTRQVTAKRATTKKLVATTAKPEKVRATESFAVDVDGDPMIVHKGEVVSVKHAVVKGHEHLFEPTAADAHVDHD